MKLHDITPKRPVVELDTYYYAYITEVAPDPDNPEMNTIATATIGPPNPQDVTFRMLLAWPSYDREFVQTEINRIGYFSWWISGASLLAQIID